MIKKTYLLSFLFTLLLCGCRSNCDKELVAEFNYDYYLKGKNTPAEFMVTSIGSGPIKDDIFILRGLMTGDREQARKNVIEFKKQAALGFNWPEKKPREIEIPYSSDFKKAMVFHGEYPVGQRDVINKKTSEWKICWDEKYLRFMAEFKDKDIQSNKEKPWEGDSVEFFIMPERRLKVYREIVISPAGTYHAVINGNSKWGLFMLDIDSVKAQGIIVKKAVQKDGFKVTCSMPWNELPGYFRGNLPKPGELIHVMMVRTNKTGDDKALHSAAVPLLYGGHNIFGYMKCTLTK